SLITEAATSDYQNMVADRHTSRVIKSLAVGSAILLALVFVSAVIDKREGQSEVDATRAALIARIQAADSRVVTAQQNLTQANADLQAAESAHLAGTSLAEQTRKRLEILRRATGFTELTGAGLQVTVDDAPSAGSTPSGALEPGKVQDGDLQSVVNGLWAAGATGIAINGQRLTAASAIRNAGEAILVDYRPLSPPYRIVAISNNADATAGTFRDGVSGLLLEQLASRYGVVWTIGTIGEATIPAATNASTFGGN
ncbi:MAG: DUF881 domain-containing protein, partial [Actinobacteria bacterium]|nr:DUF881 domain-containing protein [Actinomycetota bacterium]